MTDNRWTAIATLSTIVSSAVTAIGARQKHPYPDPSLHERVALLEKRLDDIEAKDKDE